jgi:hypothetical protein
MASLIRRIRTRLCSDGDVDYSRVRILVKGHLEETLPVDLESQLDQIFHSITNRLEEIIQEPGSREKQE